ncbi:MAG: Chemotaxis protein methyltransferase CheR [Deltaproteobacteria bacterium]|nr:Chemotaxis protein methyltransferase CheR [Deltaproteobacteria bacterium]
MTSRACCGNPAEPLVAELEQVCSPLDVETARCAALQTACEASRGAEEALRAHLVAFQRVTSALCQAVTFADIGRVVTGELAKVIDATRIGLVIRGELIALRGVTTPDDPAALADALDQLAASWTGQAACPPELAWLGSPVIGLVPLELCGARVGTVIVGLERAQDGSAVVRALLDDLAQQIAIAVDRACSLDRAEHERKRAEAANHAKDQLFSMLGHELRNPLSPILTATQLMRLRAPEALAKERITIERSVTHLMRLVDDLLDVSRITRGNIDLVRAPVELSEIVAQALELTSAAMQDRGHRVDVSVDLGLDVDVDRRRMIQVVATVLSNAAKFTPQGGVIEVTAMARGEWVELAVSDNGIGIGAELLPHVFELFVQAPQGPERRMGGLGVGLAIARKVVELHGGTITASSGGEGAGSRFAVALPRRVKPRGIAVPAKRATPMQSAHRILVVDDNEDAAWLLAEALRLSGHEVCVSHDGLSALELARGWNPQIAFLDVGLPGMDGYMLCRHLLELPTKPRIVAVTGYGQPSDRDRAHEAGFDLHFVKPVSLRDVHRAIASFATD